MVSIPACHAGNRGSIPRRGVTLFFSIFLRVIMMQSDSERAVRERHSDRRRIFFTGKVQNETYLFVHQTSIMRTIEPHCSLLLSMILLVQSVRRLRLQMTKRIPVEAKSLSRIWDVQLSQCCRYINDFALERLRSFWHMSVELSSNS